MPMSHTDVSPSSGSAGTVRPGALPAAATSPAGAAGGSISRAAKVAVAIVGQTARMSIRGLVEGLLG